MFIFVAFSVSVKCIFILVKLYLRNALFVTSDGVFMYDNRIIVPSRCRAVFFRFSILVTKGSLAW